MQSPEPSSTSTVTSSSPFDDEILAMEEQVIDARGIKPHNGNGDLTPDAKPSGSRVGVKLGLMMDRRPFYGRKQELEELKKLYRASVVCPTRTSCSCQRAVVIKGVSGTGKTALVQQLVKQLTAADACDEKSGLAPLVLQGKYDEMLRQEPFSALEQAFGNFFSDPQMMTTSNTGTCTNGSTSSSHEESSTSSHTDSATDDQWKDMILKEIGGETGLNVLKDIIPALSTWFNLHRRYRLAEPTVPSAEAPQRPKRRSSRRQVASAQKDDNSDRAPESNNNNNNNNNTSNNTSSNNNNNAFKSNQLHYVFGKFFHALTKTTAAHSRPLLLILDDLNWADAASLELLTYLLSAPSLQKCPFFLIGTYRTTETDREGSRLDKLQQQNLFRSITLQNHTREEITEWLSRELKCNSLECNMLTSAIYEKTHGNFLFTLHLVEELQRQGVLRTRQERKGRQQRQFSCSSSAESSVLSTTTCNSWDDKDIVQFVEQSRTRTMVDSIADKIQHLPNPQVKQAVILASYLGTNFDVPTLHALHEQVASQEQWDNSNSRYHEDGNNDEVESSTTRPTVSLSQADVIKTLDVAVLEGLLYNAMGSSTYTFVHDGVREAAYNMIPAGPERDQLLYRMGHFLREQSLSSSTTTANNNNQSTLLFVAARHWSCLGATTNLVDPVELAQLYLDCGSRAKAMSAFEDAALYFDHGLNALLTIQGVVDLWAAHYNLTLQLYKSAAEMELLAGNVEKGLALGRVVLKNAKTVLEKIPTYSSMEAAMGQKDRHDEALALNMDALAELDSVPSTFMGIGDFFTVKKLINNTSDEEILALPKMDDPRELAITEALGNTCMRSFLVGKPLLMIAVTLRQVKRTLKVGLSSQAPLLFAGYGCALLQGMGHPNTGRRMGRLAKQIARIPGYNEHECKTLYLLGSLIELWTEPYDNVIETYERGYELGMTSGCYDYGFASELDALLASFLAGRSLDRISERFHNLKQQVDQYNLEALKKVLNPFGTLLFFMTGRRPGDVHRRANVFLNGWGKLEAIEELKPDSSNKFTLTWAYLDRMILAFYLGNLDLAEKLCKVYHNLGPDQTFFFGSLGSFFSALLYANLAHKSRASKHKNLAHKYTKEMKKLLEKGCNKLGTWHSILKAECMSISKPQKQSLVQQMYDQAITSARESKCVNDQALASELAGEYFLRQKRPHTAKGYLVHACSFYREWGAHEKVNQLLQKHQSTLTVDDLPQVGAADDVLRSEYYPIISCVGSSAGDGSVCDDLSALTPIPENRTLSNNSRWESCGSGHQKDAVAAPPLPPSRRDVCSDKAPCKPPSRREVRQDAVMDTPPSKPPSRHETRPDVVIDTAQRIAAVAVA
ncbi:Serine threonine kinase with two-component sensor domain [Seminavis robusta]|uniref:Serine threonine kinase with two-component sensor domain n=1 Tax=Seminavis robusta TaxID=568900 RepID=A0A9N8EJ63_9STRA|nr:Serine threonine kinase with two-component sensor domain [Seminavis robusta]|eukprot:Sro1264_g257350.1 Serine threonine kinase with two-component sensor domain (1355) ;mRNA; f:14968-19116